MVQWHLPELKSYCGLLSLRSGIYAKAIINLVLIVLLVFYNIQHLIKLIRLGVFLHENDFVNITSSQDKNMTEREAEYIENLYKTLIAFFLVWLVFKIIYVVVICWTVWAIYRQRERMLKVLFYLNIPHWVFDLLISIMTTMLTDIGLLVVMHITLVAEGYNLLAIHSEYKRMTGKVAIRHDTISEANIRIYPNGFVSPPHRNLNCTTVTNELHCQTCTCNLTPILQNSPMASQIRLSNTGDNVTPNPRQGELPPTYENKELNFKEEPIIYNQTQLIEHQSSVIDYDVGLDEPQCSGDAWTAAVTPTSQRRASKNSDGEEKKVDLTDIPVIYDETQLNTGSSPVIEDRTILN